MIGCTENFRKFNKDKDKILHLAKHNAGVQHRLGWTCLRSSSVERDLGVLVNKQLHVSEQCAVMAKEANRIIDMMD